jgi:hypothetical protein
MRPDELQALVLKMRELGVLQADGVVLGPVPPRAAQLDARAAQGAPVQQELAEAIRAEKLYALREDVRLQLAASRPNISDEECDALIGPDAIAALGL